MSIKLGLTIPTPITVSDYIYILSSGGFNKTQKYLIDELQMVLYQMNVEAATFNEDHAIFIKKEISNDD